MINPGLLKQYPINTLDNEIVEFSYGFADTEPNKVSQNDYRLALNLINVFCDVTSTQTALIEFEQTNFSLHLSLGVVGFVYSEIDATPLRKHRLLLTSLKVLRKFCEHHHTPPPTDLKSSCKFASDDVKHAIQYYKSSYNPDPKRMSFYGGWAVTNNQGGIHFINLIDCHNHYGTEFTNKLHTAMASVAIKEVKKTLLHLTSYLVSLLRTLTLLFPNLSRFSQAMSASNQHISIATVYNVQLLEAKSNGLCIKSFHDRWRTTVRLFDELFIQHKLVEKPLIALFCPEFKSSGKQITNRTKLKNDNLGNVFNGKLITKIPLSYSDDKAIETIFESIKADINHVVFHCECLVAETTSRYENFQKLKQLGKVKKKSANGTTGRGHSNPVDMAITKNVCATFAHYGLNSPGKSGAYLAFLGFPKNADQCYKLLSLPTPYLLYPFLLLLIRQHPTITASWLLNWELYDKQGRLHGFKQVKGVWLAVSEKPRKGSEKSQQSIILNEKSKLLVEQIIQLTANVRAHLKAVNDHSYRAMLIVIGGVNSTPRRMTGLVAAKYSTLANRIQTASPYRSTEQAADIVKSLSFRSMRVSCGIRVYLKTQSVHAMSEALGHDKYDPKLISKYLPQPIWNYFTNRWVRIFQNAIVYEAMKNSPLLFEAIDISEDELEDFLNNHALGELPQHIKIGKNMTKNIANDNIREIFSSTIFMMSTGLLQVLSTIVELVENKPKKRSITATGSKWYETAKFILEHISESLVNKQGNMLSITNDVKDMHKLAKEKPLDLSVLERAVLC